MSDPRRALLRVTKALEDREREALRIYDPQPQQEPIFRSRARRLLIRGGNRSGKTLSGAVRIADRVTGFDRYGFRVDPARKVLCVSLDFTLMSENVYRKLFEPGAFRYCKNCLSVRHICACEGDWKERSAEAPPLIPPRLVKNFAWLDKGRGIPAKAWLKTGATMDFRSTDQGRAKFQGIAWDDAWMDEEATNDEDIVNEIERGLIDRAGYAQITATPLAASTTMVTWSERAWEEKADNELRVSKAQPTRDLHYEEVQLFTDDNLALGKAEIEAFFEGMGEEEEGVRRRGDFLVQQGLVYGREFDKKVHLIDAFEIPQDWTLYEVQDPGHAVAFATLYWAVDPDGVNYIIDELYLRRADISDVVKQQRDLVGGRSPALSTYHRPQRSIIDPASAQVGAGMKGRSVRDQIHGERLKRKHFSWQGQHKTYRAHNEVQAGIFAVKALLRKQENGKPLLFVMRHCRHFLRELRRYRWPRPQPGKDVIEKRGPIKKDDHLMDCLRYGALGRFEWVPPETRPGWGGNPRLRKSIKEFMRKRRKERIGKARKAFSISSHD